jgi:hypothetical protein
VTADEMWRSGGGTLVLPAAPVWAARPGKDGATVVTLGWQSKMPTTSPA